MRNIESKEIIVISYSDMSYSDMDILKETRENRTIFGRILYIVNFTVSI
jgi:hypothetical protein